MQMLRHYLINELKEENCIYFSKRLQISRNKECLCQHGQRACEVLTWSGDPHKL